MLRQGTLIAAIACALALTAAADAGAAGTGPVAGKSVVGGSLTASRSLPSTVTLLLGNQFCSGSVVSPTTVVTAAHCVTSTHVSKMRVRANSASSFKGGEVIPVSAAIPHPGYDLRTHTGIINDIAVLKLARPTSATPIALPTAAEDAARSAAGSRMFIAGFGRSNATAVGKPLMGRLRQAPVVARSACSGPGYTGFSASAMVCASGNSFVKAVSGKRKHDVERATCFGDSGGPLLARTTSGPRLLGVTSYGSIYPQRFDYVSCGLKGFPDVYTRVSAHLPFITQHL